MSSKTRAISFGLLLVLGLGAAGAWWIQRPKGAAERFIALASAGRFDEAQALLVPPSSIRAEEGGAVLVVDRQGATRSVPGELLPFVAGQTRGAEPENGALERLRGRYAFAVSATGAGQPTPRADAPLTLHLVAHGGRLEIERAE